MRKKERRMSTICQARKSENHVRHAKQVARARKTVSHEASYESLQLRPRSPLPQALSTRVKDARQLSGGNVSQRSWEYGYGGREGLQGGDP